MHLTKTDFLLYLQCQKSFWLYKNAPDEFPHGEFSLFMQKLVREGYEVERYVKQYFHEHHPSKNIELQAEFETSDGLYTRVDALETDEFGVTTLYEVKSSTSVKKEQIQDACFQKICAERAGRKIHRVILVHLNGDYVRNGEIETQELLRFQEITTDVADIQATLSEEIEQALVMLHRNHIEYQGCGCLKKTRANHCDTFGLFNPDIPKPSIYSLPRISASKLAGLVDEDIFDLDDLPGDFKLSEPQSLVTNAYKGKEPQVNLKAIRKTLAGYQCPLFFFDFETYGSAVPIIDGISPHQQFPVQYSLHILSEDGTIEHKEFLQRTAALPFDLVEQMGTDIGPVGSVVSWYAPFEKGRNRDMAEMFPEKAEFLMDINDRMVDLMDIFKRDYVDAEFDGSTSIKKVLPVLCPKLSYADLDVQSGSAAMDAWARMIKECPEQSNLIAKSLLDYCKLDTLAMVEIYRFLKNI